MGLTDRIPPVAKPAGALALAGPGRSIREVFAGATLAALALPLNIGYSTAAGLPPTVGIYATLLPLVVFALTTGSLHLMTGPDATIAALLGAAIVPLAAEGADPEELAWAAALLVGLVLAFCWALQLGRLVRFLSKAVLVGFIAGLGIEILTSQVRKIMNVTVEADGWLREVFELVKAVPDASVASVAVGAGTIVIVRLCKRFAPKVPGALVAIVVVTVVVALTDPGGVALLGEVPSGLPTPTFPTIGLDEWLALVPVAVAIAALTIAEGVLIAQSAARRHGEHLDPNGEVFAFGAANVAAAVTGGMPVGASASRTAALEATGSRTQVPAVVAALLVAVVVVFFTDIVAELPSAALAGLVANAVVTTIDVAELRRFAKVRRSELLLAVTCAAGVLLVGPLGGIALAAVLSAFDVVRRAADAPWTRLSGPPVDRSMGRFTGEPVFEALPEGLRVVRPGGPLFFANADELREVVEGAAGQGAQWLVLDMEVVSDIDPTAADALGEGLEVAGAYGMTVALSRLRADLAALLARYGLPVGDGGMPVFESNRAAEEAYLREVSGR